ncbi:MAG: hypothetical protein KGH72_02060 [Candidatus Micrarchaeota archaeon]|nr:hypothetical protein [Candidatus Micrarchaeota archaeon]
MTDVRQEKTKELIVHHVYESTLDELLKTAATRAHGMPILYWAAGTAFYYESLPPIMNEEIESDYANGKDHWGEVFYAKLEKYSPTIELNDNDFRGVKVRVIDASNYVPQKDFARWVNEDFNK